MNKIPCSISILTLNSGKNLRRCLESVKDFDDVYILDGNSTDDTIAIAQEFDVPVYKQYDTDEKNVRIKDFTEMRKKADSLRKHDWLLLVDSDEYLSAGFVAEVRSVLNANPDVKTAYYVVKKVIMGNRIIEHSFHESSYILRLYNMQSGAAWKGSKMVHEKLYLPDDVKIVKLTQPCYSYFIPSYREAVKKDNYYLFLTRQKMFAPGASRTAKMVLVSASLRNFLRAGNVVYKSLKVYCRHGFRYSLPPQHVWRYVRYHVIISYYRFRQIFH
ncbi:hypothetical protein A2477_03960 [Candidatus Falkowbacteria bacterium RIFOXYC2_FULL_47_12]|uniref:Glycosyltransferase 2-like domain-containing protein n=2 Tax=Candidatus Falkowiibacteriota TaxID=1752728 RepID=A0A1F5TP24_9BACT|nr:MAG: hypothetical protein A2242_04560 [Candidatus Falkowbacteria bacterium RIFOXYA2_FULL_47_9]OGF40630.1 MAG: hypothetical protein A2477_03960 [Candidatus Falkowbacteria bacterium RIFOXYC2_FULL_47_12]